MEYSSLELEVMTLIWEFLGTGGSGVFECHYWQLTIAQSIFI